MRNELCLCGKNGPARSAIVSSISFSFNTSFAEAPLSRLQRLDRQSTRLMRAALYSGRAAPEFFTRLGGRGFRWKIIKLGMYQGGR